MSLGFKGYNSGVESRQYFSTLQDFSRLVMSRVKYVVGGYFSGVIFSVGRVTGGKIPTEYVKGGYIELFCIDIERTL